MRINIAGSPVPRHRSKKASTRGLSWPPSSPFTPGDALKAGRADTLTPRPLTATRRSLPCSLFLTPALVVATAGRERAAPRPAPRRGPSVPRPWRASAAASAWPSPCRASAQAERNPNQITTPIGHRFSSDQTITVLDPRHPLCGQTLPLVAITHHTQLGRCCVVWLRPHVERLIPVQATNWAFDPTDISPSPLSLAAVEQLLRVFQ